MAAFLDLHARLERLSKDDLVAITEEFGPTRKKTVDPERLAYLGSKAPALLARLRSKRERSKADALVLAIGCSGSDRVARPIVEMLVQDRATGLHAWAVEDSLAMLGPHAVDAVHGALARAIGDAGVRASVFDCLVRAAARLGDARAVPLLERALRSGIRGRSAVLVALDLLSRGRPAQRRQLLNLIERTARESMGASRNMHPWPPRVSPLRRQLLRGRLRRAVRRWK